MDNNTLTVLTILSITVIFFLLIVNLDFLHNIYWLKQDNKEMRKEIRLIKSQNFKHRI